MTQLWLQLTDLFRCPSPSSLVWLLKIQLLVRDKLISVFCHIHSQEFRQLFSCLQRRWKVFCVGDAVSGWRRGIEVALVGGWMPAEAAAGGSEFKDGWIAGNLAPGPVSRFNKLWLPAIIWSLASSRPSNFVAYPFGIVLFMRPWFGSWICFQLLPVPAANLLPKKFAHQAKYLGLSREPNWMISRGRTFAGLGYWYFIHWHALL